MNDLSRLSRPQFGGRQFWLLPAIIAGILIGIALRFLAPQLLANTALVGEMFWALMLVVIAPLTACQLALALNNPRERIRRGVSHSKILVQVLVVTAILLAVSLVASAIFAPTGAGNFLADFLTKLDPGTFVSFETGGGIYTALILSLVLAVILGALGDRAQFLVTVCNRISRASIRTFRLVLWVAPIGLVSVVGRLGLSAGAAENATQVPPLLLALTSIVGLFLYASVVLGVDWMVGQLRPAKREPRFDRDRRPQRRVGSTPYSAPSRPGGSPGRTGQRPIGEPRRDRERSPFEMGVSTTPVLDIGARSTTGPGTPPAPPAEPSRRQDSRPRFSRDAQTEPPRDNQRDGQREGQRDGQRAGYRDREPRPERREGGRDGLRDRGPRGNRGDRPDRDRGPRGFRPDHRESPQPADATDRPEPTVETPQPIDTVNVSADLARVREQLNRPSSEDRTLTPREEPRVASRPPQPAPERREQPTPTDVHQPNRPEAPVTPEEVHYGRSRHRKHERPEPEPMLPGIEPPPMPEMIDHYSTDDMAFGRAKRKKTVK